MLSPRLDGGPTDLDEPPCSAVAPVEAAPATSGKAGAKAGGRWDLERGLVVAAVVVGTVERWWVATHPIGTLTSDGAVIGLMALHLLHHGQLPAYMWGQAYGGSLEALLTAGAFAVAGVGTGQLLATTALSSALVAVALWRAGRHLVGERAARLGALVWWVFPATYLWRALKPGGTYMIGLALALGAVGAVARIRRGERGWKVVALAGLLTGLALWSSPMSFQLLVPAALWALPALLRLGRRLALLVAGVLVGAAPALAYGLRHAWSNLRVPGRHHLLLGYGSRLLQFFHLEVPLALSLRFDGTLGWALGPAGVGLAVLAAAGFVAVAVAVLGRRSPRCALPVLTLALLPFLFALNTLARHVGQSRYVMFGATMGLLLLGVGLENGGHALARWWKDRVRRRAVALAAWSTGLGLLAALGFSTLAMQPAAAVVGFSAGGVAMPTDDASLLSLVAEHHVRDAYASYWIAYRLMFETGGGVDVAPYTFDRYPPLDAQVSRSSDPSYLFVSSSPGLPSLEQWCARHGVALDVWRRGAFTVVQPDRRLAEERVRRLLGPRRRRR